MEQRLAYPKVAPKAYQALFQLESYVRQSGLEHSLIELVKLRASQINQCAFCIDMHTKDARAHGESEQRLYLLNAWREAPFYTPRERAALEWTEAVTLIAQNQIPDELYERVSQHFTDVEMVNLTVAIGMINTWNRMSISFRTEVGTYQPPKKAE